MTTYYHGTSSIFNIQDKILPASKTGIKREDFREEKEDYIFLTTSLKSAYRYAEKCVAKYGGTPVVYECEVDDEPVFQRVNEFAFEEARIIKEVK